MIDTDYLQKTVASGLKKYLNCPVIRSNQTAKLPKYPFVTFTITTPASENRGTYGEYDDDTARKPCIQTWSITAHSDNYAESLELANKARTWLDYSGVGYLNDNGVIVQSVGQIADRSNLLTVGYQYSQGFDCFFWLFDEAENKVKQIGTIDEIDLNNGVEQ